MKLKIIMIVIGILLWFSFIILLIVTSKNEIGSAEIASLVTMALLPFFIYLIIKLSNKGKRKNNTYSTPQKPIPPPQNYQYRPQNQSFANIQTQNNLRILQETCNILETTNNLETFFSRFEVGKRIVSDLNNRNYLSDFYKKANLLKIEVLQKSFKNEEKNISNLKTAKAQQKHWESYLALLKKYEEYYTTDYHTEYENIVQAVQAKITLARNGNDILKVAKEALTSGIKITSSIDNSDLEKYSREASEKGYAAHVNSYKNLDFKNISLKDGNPLPLDEIEKKFLKALSNQQVDKLNFPVYWTYEYHVNYKEWITKLIENGYVKITPATEDFSFLTVEQLKSVLRLLHLPTSGKKQELIARISNQAATENALKELDLYVERFVLTDIGREAVKSIPKPIVKEITYEDLLLEAEEQRKQYENSKVKKYKILGTLDFETCSKCGKMDGKVFDLKDYKPGITAPPFHDGCRCTTTPHLDEDLWEDLKDERIARGKDGKTYYVPGDMTYSQWRKTIQ